MKHTAFILLSALLLVSCATVEPDTSASSASKKKSPPEVFSPSFIIPPVDGTYYYETLEKLKEEKIETLSEIDFVKFRFAYLMVRDRDRLWVPVRVEESLRESISSNHHDQTLELCETVQKYDFTDIYSHVIRNYLLEQAGQNMAFYKAYVNHLLDSIFDSGDGRSPETAFHVTQVKEEYELLKFMELYPQEKITFEKGGHSFDVLTCTKKSGDIYQIYFDITEHFRILNQILGR
jgi:hypothetical protein